MSKKLNVAIFQMDSKWESAHENCNKAEKWITEHAGDADLVVLPEMFATGFSMKPEEIAQPMDGEIVNRMRDIALRSGKAIICSIAIDADLRSGDHGYVNRLFFFTPDGIWLTYDKRHTFRMAGEHLKYHGGSSKTIIYYKGFRICPLICYDLRFPVWSRYSNDYDVLIYIAAWPDVRSYAWINLLRARAIENQTYLIGVNRVGEDPKNRYSGDSVVLDFLGKPIVQAQEYTEQMCHATLELAPLEEFRKGFPAYLDADSFILNN